VAGGCISLISSGVGEANSDFFDATPSGSDVFFTTRSKLVPADQDTLMDLYDARENGGFSGETVSPACTTTDSCRTAPVAQPALFGAPASQTLTGTGNPAPVVPVVVKQKKAPVKCAKGRKRSHGKCVKVRSKAKKARKGTVNGRRHR
jgi:hypothetical protein